MRDIRERFKKNLKNKNLISNNNNRLLLGVSGGPDSLTMLDLFTSIRDDFNLEIIVFHLNHLFREKASEEAEYVRKICEKKAIKTIIKTHDVPKYVENNNLSPEEGAREIRFKYLKEIFQNEEIDKIGLAHNKDDLVETVLLNIFRGCGMKGLKGIEDNITIDGMKIIHPLLIFFRSEIIDYCKSNNLEPVYDPSNESDLYSRNRIRNNILPLIENQINPNVKQVITRMTETVKEDFNFIKHYSEKKFKEILIKKDEKKYILDLKKMKNLHPTLIKRIINIILTKLKGNIDNFYYKHYNDIINFIESNNTGDLLDLPDNINIKISYQKLIIIKGSFSKIEKYSKLIENEGEYLLPYNQKISVKIIPERLNWRNYKEDNLCLIDFNKVDFPLKVRNRRDGDTFIPLGMVGHKKVKDFFIDNKVPDYMRDKIPIVFDGKENLIWICGYRMAEQFKLEKESKKTILIKYQKED
ncbi:MAG: tRNA lysidine(34) synthetase TilS [Halanaerobiales bacterium]|nr:tRNA lysidine(34) synthetase TilS [Halanaerobiales bacterium]